MLSTAWGPCRVAKLVDPRIVFSRYGRARKIEGSQGPPLERPVAPHPDARRPTQRIPFAQLRALVVRSLDDDEADPASEFEERATTYRPLKPARVSTLDDVIASLLRTQQR